MQSEGQKNDADPEDGYLNLEGVPRSGLWENVAIPAVFSTSCADALQWKEGIYTKGQHPPGAASVTQYKLGFFFFMATKTTLSM